MSELEPLVIGDLVVEKPIIQGGMGIGISLYRLAGTVTRAGDMDITSAARIGFKEPDFTTNFMEANVRPIRREMRLARETAPQGAVGFNIMVAIKHYGMWVEKAMKAGANIIISGAGLPVSLPEYVEAVYAEMKERPAHRIKPTPIVSSTKSAMAICKMWDRRCRIAPDLVVVGGPLAGSHLGFLLGQLSVYGTDTANVSVTYDRDAYDQEVKAVMKMVEEYRDKYGRRISVVTTGGIYTHEDMIYQPELGADGVQVTTRFVTTEECDASDAYKQAYINAGKRDIVITRSPVGMPGRAILNPFLSRIKSGSRPTVRSCFRCLEHCDIGAVPYCITMALVNTAKRNTDHGLLFCRGDAYRAEKTDTVDNVMKELAGELA